VRWKLEDACWRRVGATPTAAAGTGAADTPRRYAKRTPTCTSDLRVVIVRCLKLDNSCCYARYSCGNKCNVVVKLVQEDHCFSYILLLAAIDMFLREANSYNRALALRNSRLLTNKLANADENITSLAEVKMAATAANRSFSNCYLSLALPNLAPSFGF